ENHDVDLLLVHDLKGFSRAASGRNFIAVFAQVKGKQLAHLLLIINDQDLLHTKAFEATFEPSRSVLVATDVRRWTRMARPPIIDRCNWTTFNAPLRNSLRAKASAMAVATSS